MRGFTATLITAISPLIRDHRTGLRDSFSRYWNLPVEMSMLPVVWWLAHLADLASSGGSIWKSKRIPQCKLISLAVISHRREAHLWHATSCCGSLPYILVDCIPTGYRVAREAQMTVQTEDDAMTGAMLVSNGRLFPPEERWFCIACSTAALTAFLGAGLPVHLAIWLQGRDYLRAVCGRFFLRLARFRSCAECLSFPAAPGNNPLLSGRRTGVFRLVGNLAAALTMDPKLATFLYGVLGKKRHV